MALKRALEAIYERHPYYSGRRTSRCCRCVGTIRSSGNLQQHQPQQQGPQFTGVEFLSVLKRYDIAISVDDGKGCAPPQRDNMVVERFWRSLKYEYVYLHTFETPARSESARGSPPITINDRIKRLNSRTPDSVYHEDWLTIKNVA